MPDRPNLKRKIMKITIKYPNGVNMQLDDQIRHLANLNNGVFTGSGVFLETSERDIAFEFETKRDYTKFINNLAPFISVNQ